MQFGEYAMWLMPPPVNEAYMAGGDYFRPRDFLKFGELFLEGGRWNGKPVIARSWLQTVTARRTKIEGETGEYGYGWHIYAYTSGGRIIRAIGAGGNGGQLLFVFPQLDMTVMITAANYNQFPVWRAYIEKLVPRILAAVRN
jgi:CubicO group peptidase (beta-lactamase class C family)